MKKIFIAVMAFAAIAFTGCSKEDFNDSNELILNFTVADKPSLGNATRAVKSGWESGDQILLVFQGQSGHLDYTNGSNTITLTYNGTNWSANKSKINTSLINSVGKKTYAAIYHPGNVTLGTKDNSLDGYLLNGYKGGEQLQYSGLYSYENDVIDLGTISFTRASDDFQISVKGLTGDNWKLSIMDETITGNNGINIIHAKANNLYLRLNKFTLGQYGEYIDATGVEYGGDVSFFFTKISLTATKLTFVLTNDTDTYYYQKTGVTDSTLEGGKAYYLPAITAQGWVKKQ
ncbi:MAG: hypothetical protein IKV12_00970 [Alistipes sp.]|nr:hypothetical protein [Alistipes sp.]